MVRSLGKGLGYLGLGLFVGLPLKLMPRKEAFGVEKESGISHHLRQRWTVIGSISPQKSASGVAVLLDETSGKTQVFRIGDIIPGTDFFRLVSVHDQKVLVSDGKSRVTLDHQGITAKSSENYAESSLAPLSALESYYQNLEQNRFPTGETYEEFIDRLPEFDQPQYQPLSREDVLGPSRFTAPSEGSSKPKSLESPEGSVSLAKPDEEELDSEFWSSDPINQGEFDKGWVDASSESIGDDRLGSGVERGERIPESPWARARAYNRADQLIEEGKSAKDSPFLKNSAPSIPE